MKKILGFIFLIIACSLAIYALHKIYINPNIFLTTKKLISGYFGKHTLVILLFNSGYFVLIFLLFKLGFKWTRLLNKRV